MSSSPSASPSSSPSISPSVSPSASPSDFDDFEISDCDSQPVELYEFGVGTTYYRYTSANVDITYNGFSWTQAILQRTDIMAGAEAARSEIEIPVDRNVVFARLWISQALEAQVTVVIYRGHAGFYQTIWNGFVSDVRFDSNQALIKCQSKIAYLSRLGLVRPFTRQCPLALYSSGLGQCNADRSSFEVLGTLDGVSGTTLTSSVFATKTDGFFVGGDIWIGLARRTILTHSSNDITVTHAISGAMAGDSFKAYAGCPKDWDTCGSRFSNQMNYGGQQFIPDKNPFTGDPII